MDICQILINMIKSVVAPKAFSTGSKGFHAAGKITVDGVRYQAQAQAVLIGSKADPSATVDATTDEITAALAGLVADGLAEKTFSTGRTGYWVTGKVEAHGQRFQASVQAVRLS